MMSKWGLICKWCRSNICRTKGTNIFTWYFGVKLSLSEVVYLQIRGSWYNILGKLHKLCVWKSREFKIPVLVMTFTAKTTPTGTGFTLWHAKSWDFEFIYVSMKIYTSILHIETMCIQRLQIYFNFIRFWWMTSFHLICRSRCGKNGNLNSLICYNWRLINITRGYGVNVKHLRIYFMHPSVVYFAIQLHFLGRQACF